MATVRTTTLTRSPLLLLGIDTAHYLLTVGPFDLTHRQPSCGLPLSGAALPSRHQAVSSVWTASEKLLWFCGNPYSGQ
ncbi:hypothetical protein V8C26DRAFT_428378 [Trichoderma gracile]